MNVKTLVAIFLAGFVCVCVILAVVPFAGTGADRSENHILPLASVADAAEENQGGEAVDGDFQVDRVFPQIGANNAVSATEVLGGLDPKSGFKFEIEFTNKGAAISRAALSEFDNRDRVNPLPLEVLKPVDVGSGGVINSLENGRISFPKQNRGYWLNRLNWKVLDRGRGNDGSERVSFEAVLKEATAEKGDVVRLIKTYTVRPGTYMLECDLEIENLSGMELKVGFDMQGPIGMGIEGRGTGDGRKTTAAFILSDGTIESSKKDNNKLRSYKRKGNREKMKFKVKGNSHLLWAAVSNKYFTAILRPVPEGDQSWVGNVRMGSAEYYDPRIMERKADLDENNSFKVQVGSVDLGVGERERFAYQLYLGPKDKTVFEKNELYNKLGFIHAIDFLPCFCCPDALIHTLAFGIMSVMKVMYAVIPNYGVVIIIFVFLIRLVLHPLTKKGQVSMMAMQKLSPEMEVVKKKYANNRAEMNKQISEVFKKHGMSPASGMMGAMPMFVQMPIWIALYSAIYANIELRGAGFLPFWITDLSVPDALITFDKPFVIPLVGWTMYSFNVLPILLGVAFFLQQKLMSASKTAPANPQMAQQQKMMMIMMPIMFPLMLYSRPSGLNLYIMASTFAGVVEQIVIRKHIREKEEAESTGLVSVTSKTGGKAKKKKAKPFYKNSM